MEREVRRFSGLNCGDVDWRDSSGFEVAGKGPCMDGFLLILRNYFLFLCCPFIPVFCELDFVV